MKHNIFLRSLTIGSRPTTVFALTMTLQVSRTSRDGQFRIIYYSRIVKPNPESESFLATSTINMKAFITSLQQQKHNQKTSLLQCNQIMSARVCIMRKRTHSINVCVCELVFNHCMQLILLQKENLCTSNVIKLASRILTESYWIRIVWDSNPSDSVF